MNSLKNSNLQAKRVLVRCDFNVPIKNGKVLDDFKIQRTLETISFLKKAGAKIILTSHLGSPLKTERKKQRLKEFSLKPVQKKLQDLLKEKIRFSKRCIKRKAKKEIKRLKNGQILILENLRFEKGEKENNEKFAKELAKLGDVYINEAFSTCHRNHASIVFLPKLLPHFVGLNFEKEIEVLSRISQNPKHPLVVIIGGIKIASKIGVIKKFLEVCDHLLLGGKIVNNILTVKGISIGKPWPEEKVVEIIKKINLTDPKVHLPIDVLVSPDISGEVYVRNTGPGSVRKDEGIFDIGIETINTFSEIIKQAQTIFWSGPLGVFENEKFEKGTQEIAKIIGESKDAFTVAGGGDTVRALKKFNLLDNFSFVSTGGSAMLAFLTGEKLPGIEALR